MCDCEEGIHQDDGYGVCSLCGVNLPKIVSSPITKTGRTSRLNFRIYPQIDNEWALRAEKSATDRKVYQQGGYPKSIVEWYCLIDAAHELGRPVSSSTIAGYLKIPVGKRHKIISFATQLAILTNLAPIKSTSSKLEELPNWIEKLKGLGSLSNNSIEGLRMLGKTLSRKPEFQKLTPNQTIAVCIGIYWSTRLDYTPPIDKLAEYMKLDKHWLNTEIAKY
jgi:hypothetical protein